jgi:hypothetical protein
MEIAGVKPLGAEFEVLMEDKTTFRIKRPNLADEADLNRFINELLPKVGLIEAGRFVASLALASIFASL